VFQDHPGKRPSFHYKRYQKYLNRALQKYYGNLGLPPPKKKRTSFKKP
jgi:hypothetical protein